MYEKIYGVIHVGKNLLIVGYNTQDKWSFRVVTQEGKIVKEMADFLTAESAEKEGYTWIEKNLSSV
ncbi:hypothetical protein [Cyanobacterium sp. Dongsha4]|uniref:hypothetical protein n=1 Tax=Cyanobacterium sp. DS4 TaxID=2878255 RepID=UPI002E81425F|nr:hypothetical protein [Cyanobacterium sp. Dongsha4]WVK99982.1 hypothetical protein Dongsha4_15140 [Cyanobacterium sp. Dongsha4]